MSLVDLSNIDLLDAVLAHNFSDNFREKFLNTYVEAYTMVLGDALNKELTKEDSAAIDVLLNDPDLTPEKLDQFYIDRIPHFQAKITLLALEFKKRFLLDVYKNKVQEYQSSKNKQGYEAWKQIYIEAQLDNWNEVNRYLKLVDSMEK